MPVLSITSPLAYSDIRCTITIVIDHFQRSQPMRRIALTVTDELYECLAAVAAKRGNGVNPLIEELLRSAGPIKAAKQSLNLEWSERQPVGKPKKVPENT